MRPHTRHAMFTVSHSLCHGGAFYPMSSLKDTLSGIIHTFITRSFIPTQENTMAMIRRMVIFVYRALVDRDLEEDGSVLPCLPHRAIALISPIQIQIVTTCRTQTSSHLC